MFVRRISNQVTIWAISFEDKDVILVYNKDRKSIITALPPNSYDLEYIRQCKELGLNVNFHSDNKSYLEEFDSIV